MALSFPSSESSGATPALAPRRVQKYPVRWRAHFCESLAAVPNVSLAAHVAGVPVSYAYALRQRDPVFAEEWAMAIERSIAKLEKVAFQRAEEQSDALLMFLLKCHAPDRYRDRLDAHVNTDLKVIIEHRATPIVSLPNVVIEPASPVSPENHERDSIPSDTNGRADSR